MVKKIDGAIPIGYIVRYKLTVKNPNPKAPIHNFIAIDELPAHLKLVEGSINVAPATNAHIIKTDNANEIRVVFTTIAAGAVIHIYFDAKVVGSGADGKVINIARICEYKPDPKGELKDGKAGREVNRDDEIVDVKANPKNPSEPYTAQAEPIIAPTEPYTAQAEPYTAQAEPYTAQAEPYTAQAEPYTAPTEPFTAPAEPFTAPAEPFIAQTEPIIAPITDILTNRSDEEDYSEAEFLAENPSVLTTKTAPLTDIGDEDNPKTEEVSEDSSIFITKSTLTDILGDEEDLTKGVSANDLDTKMMPENPSVSNTATELTDIEDEEDLRTEAIDDSQEQPVRSKLSALAGSVLAASGLSSVSKKKKRNGKSDENSLEQLHEEEYNEIFWD